MTTLADSPVSKALITNSKMAAKHDAQFAYLGMNGHLHQVEIAGSLFHLTTREAGLVAMAFGEGIVTGTGIMKAAVIRSRKKEARMSDENWDQNELASWINTDEELYYAVEDAINTVSVTRLREIFEHFVETTPDCKVDIEKIDWPSFFGYLTDEVFEEDPQFEMTCTVEVTYGTTAASAVEAREEAWDNLAKWLADQVGSNDDAPDFTFDVTIVEAVAT